MAYNKLGRSANVAPNKAAILKSRNIAFVQGIDLIALKFFKKLLAGGKAVLHALPSELFNPLQRSTLMNSTLTVHMCEHPKHITMDRDVSGFAIAGYNRCATKNAQFVSIRRRGHRYR
jgi:hypothetical protein